MLKAYARVKLEAGQTQTVPFSLDHADLALVNAAAEWVVEPGEFELYVGASSADEDLITASFHVVG